MGLLCSSFIYLYDYNVLMKFTKVSVERGMSFSQANDIWRKYTGVDDGFYISSIVSHLQLYLVFLSHLLLYLIQQVRVVIFHIYVHMQEIILNTCTFILEKVCHLKIRFYEVEPDVLYQTRFQLTNQTENQDFPMSLILNQMLLLNSTEDLVKLQL